MLKSGEVLVAVLLAVSAAVCENERAIAGRWQYTVNDFRDHASFNRDTRLVERSFATRAAVADLVGKLEEALVIEEIEFQEDGRYSDSNEQEGTWQADARHLTLALDTGELVSKTFDVVLSVLTLTYAAGDIRAVLMAGGADHELCDVADIKFEEVETLHIHFTTVSQRAELEGYRGLAYVPKEKRIVCPLRPHV